MKFITHFFIFIILFSPLVLFAQTPQYNPLVGLPGVEGKPLSASSDFNTFINALYAIASAIAALLAVIKVIIAGVKWMLTDIVTSKEEAKKDIKGALLGLLIVLSAVLILTVINPNLVKEDLNKTVMGEKYVPLANTTTNTPATLNPSLVSNYPGANPSTGISNDASAEQRRAFIEDCRSNTLNGQEVISAESNDIRCFSVPNNHVIIYAKLCDPQTPATACMTRSNSESLACVKDSGIYRAHDPTPEGVIMYSCIKP